MSPENSSQIKAADIETAAAELTELKAAETLVVPVADAVEADCDEPVSSEELKRRMSAYGEKSAACQSSSDNFQRHYYQGVSALILASLFAATGVWSVLTLVVALFATWRITSSFAIDQQCERLEGETGEALEALEQALESEDTRTLFVQCYEELKDHVAKRQLAFYLPGPIEVNRRPAQWNPLQALAL